ncbi:two pore domain potassium channel family protein [Flavobacterium silvisoli]|uniref:Two pore domain potassium channel family protein n=1 Tax=Flavobacterium silvisoli TaxID=2529433 RepID=A0A4Q9YQS4_9FLAO|nr:potassium channel family protein [Flavobacterium silvisoli]TBX64820.1 two pore domain potassium channel family protein [Flavobacterium silvisoli]
MKQFLKKLLLGKITSRDRTKFNITPIQKRIANIRAIWNNDHQDDNGIEKIVRLLLSISQLLFPGLYIKQLAHKIGYEYRDLSMDIYVLLKVAFPLLILVNDWQTNKILIALMVYVLFETILYIPTLIFASDMLSRPRSYKRSMLLLFFNYIEIVFSFGVLYTCGNNMNRPFENWYDPIYFSMVTSSSIGFGDFVPVTTYAKILVSFQALFFLSFVVLFLSFFTNKIKNKGYFDHESEEF